MELKATIRKREAKAEKLKEKIRSQNDGSNSLLKRN